MKNLKKVLALVVALTMVLGTVAFAGYTDVSEDASEYTAVSTLSSLGILTGYEDGSFNPTGDITRAEFCAVVCRALGAKVSGAAVTGFSDVAADHWASAYISYVAGLGIVNGMGDGTFAPDANVTFEQAVKMLVVALGFEPMAAQKGGYPTGYMVVANTKGITEAISAVQDAPASRAIVSQLVYNALDVPVMEQTGYGTQITYTELDGSLLANGKYKTLLTGLDVTKLDGNVINTSIVGDTTDKGFVDFKITDNYTSEDFDVTVGDAYENFRVAEGVKAEDYIQFASTVFVKEYAKNKYEIISIMPGADSQTLDLGIEEIKSINQTAGSKYIEYIVDEDTDDTKKAKVIDTVSVYYNNDASDLDAIDAEINSGKDIEIKLVENNGDNKYDAIFVKEYSYAVVDSIEDVEDGTIAAKDIEGDVDFEFDFEDDNKVITLLDKNGDAICLEDFAEGDVLAYMVGGEGELEPDDDYTWIEVINLGKNAVEGTIDEEADDAVYVDRTKYALVSGVSLELGETGTFYLTRTGKIFNFELSESIAKNYGYILGTGELDSTGAQSSSVWQVKMLTKDNEIVFYNVKKGYTNSLLTTLDVDSAAFIGVEKPHLEEVRSRLVTYTINANNELTKIEVVTPADFIDQYYMFNADAQKLFKTLADDVVIFNVAGSEDSSYVTGLASLIDDNGYKGYAKVEDGEAVCLVITDDGSHIDYTQDLAIIAGVTSIKHNEEPAKRVRYYVSGEDELKEIVIMEDDDVSEALGGTRYSYGENQSDIAIGAIMMFEDDGNGVASRYAVLAQTNFMTASEAESAGALPYATTAFATTVNDDPDVDIITGYIKTATTKNGKTTIQYTESENDTITILGSTNEYSIRNNDSSTNFKVNTSKWDAFDIEVKAKNESGYANFFIAKVVDEKVTDFIAFSVPCKLAAE